VGRIYEICADEAWTHQNPPLKRYHCFIGGLLGLKEDIDRLESVLYDAITFHKYPLEVKWANVSPEWLQFYKELVDVFFVQLTNFDLRYRQVFLDRTYIHLPSSGNAIQTDLDREFLIYYFFLKEAFGLKYLPVATETFDRIVMRLDTHSSKDHRKKLKELVEKLPVYLHRTDLTIDLGHVCSKTLRRIQICDVLLGAAGSYGNRAHDMRKAGQKRMTPYQKCRCELAKYISAKLRNLNNLTRGRNAFNWHESTGMDGNPRNKYIHKMRIWKFIPKHCQIDKGWQNDHLDKQGGYIGPDIVDDSSQRDDVPS
jgi:hypothetical protein